MRTTDIPAKCLARILKHDFMKTELVVCDHCKKSTRSWDWAGVSARVDCGLRASAFCSERDKMMEKVQSRLDSYVRHFCNDDCLREFLTTPM
jgi:hypothetical protein